jgi:hypothetical protein
MRKRSPVCSPGLLLLEAAGCVSQPSRQRDFWLTSHWFNVFELSAEFPATLAKFGFRENFAPWVLDETIRLLSAVRCVRPESVSFVAIESVARRGADSRERLHSHSNGAEVGTK